MAVRMETGVAVFIRFIVLKLVRFFYRRITVVGRENIPAEGPVIVVSNHVNGLIDPMIMRMALDRPVAFLAKSTLFGNAIGRAAMAAFNAIPVYRAKEADTVQNRKTFDLAHALMQNKGWLALFPEGVSHSEPTLQPLKTGAARIALNNSGHNVKILPVGLSYDAKDEFRSSASATVGRPFGFDDLDGSSRENAQILTQRIAAALAEVVFQAADRELWHGFRFVARWMKTGDEDGTARRLSEQFRRLPPERAAALVEETRAFAHFVSRVSVDPHALDMKLSASKLVLLVVGLPFALAGAALAWLPYRMIGPLARKLSQGEDDLISTIKALLGLVVIPATYLTEAAVTGWFFGWPAALAMLVGAPVTGYIALHYAELSLVLRRGILNEIRERRSVLLAHIEQTLDS